MPTHPWNLEAGFKLNEAVAKYVMGWKKRKDILQFKHNKVGGEYAIRDDFNRTYVYIPTRRYPISVRPFEPSDEAGDMYMVLQRLIEDRVRITISTIGKEWMVRIGARYMAKHESLNVAVCRTAVKFYFHKDKV